MAKSSLIALALLTLPVACGPAAENTPIPRPSAEAPAPSAHEQAKAEVAKLTAQANQDPLLTAWTGPYGGVPPWDKADAKLVPPAFELGIKLLLAEVEVIAQNPEKPTFQNTMIALEDSGRHLNRAEVVFGVMTTSLNGPDVQAVDREWSPKLTAAYDAIIFNGPLFGRIKALYDQRAALNLTPEQARLLERTYDQYKRQGAELDAAKKQKLGEINQQLAVLFTDFGNRVLADEDTFITLEKQEDLAGLPESLVSSYAAAAKEKKLDGKWIVMNTRSAVDPFLTTSKRRDLREKVWKAFKARGDNGNPNDTNEIIGKIVKLRAERAALLGYESHAHWRMSDTMAKDPKRAMELMLKVWPAAVKRVGEEVADMTKLAQKDDRKLVFEPWDYLYYAEKVLKARYDLDQAQLKPYFELGNMVEAAFFMAESLYGLTFHEITGKVPVFHPDVRVWEVKDKATGNHVGLFYGDNFARSGKRSGAWASGYRGRETFTGKTVTPITSNNNNFVAAEKGKPVLISLDDAQTLFHEFGHALHGLLSEVNYPSLAVTPRDFVEYPSQVHEMWVLSRPILDRFAKHHETKEPMPQKLVDKVVAASKFNTGYTTVEYLSAAIVDMKLHTIPDGKVDADAFERDTMKEIGAPKEIVMRHRLPQFNHLFTSDSYSAGYYSYLWSEVMDADTREAFKTAGNVFDPTWAKKMRSFILAPGNSTDRTEAYRQFRGRDPEIKALLEKRGFPQN